MTASGNQCNLTRPTARSLLDRPVVFSTTRSFYDLKIVPEEKMKKTVTVLLIMSLAAASLLTGCAKEEESIKIGALFAVTGGASFLGAPEARTAEMVVEEINARRRRKRQSD